MKYVYILKSLSRPDTYYSGLTSDLRARLAKHNAGEVRHTSKYKPWELKTYLAFDDDEGPDEDPYPLPFHPLELGSAVSLAILGFELEGCTSDWRFDPDDLRATRFQLHKAGQPRPRPRREMPPPPPRRPPPRASRWWWPF